MLQDKATIEVEAGAGGDGCVSFRREAHVPRGGPDGGTGGKGGDVVVVADRDLRDLSEFRHRRHFRAGRGLHGEGAQRHGKAGATLELRVPCGTVVEDIERRVRYDLTRHGQRATVARGGAGGAGNRRFVTATRQAPRFAEHGLPGDGATLELRLKLLADVGIIGTPNAGKSSLLRRLTRAAPKVADYPFTTLEPVLGTIEDDEGRQLVLADIPGLIEGASVGAGLGHEFLAHVERTRLLVHLVEFAPLQDVTQRDAFAAVRAELERYGGGLESRPWLLVLSKADLVPAEAAGEAEQEWRRLLAGDPHVCRQGGVPVIAAVSSATGAGAERLKAAVFAHAPPAPGEQPVLADGRAGEQVAEYAVYRPGERSGYRVERCGERSFRVSGPPVERLVRRHDLENPEALVYVEERLKAMGVIRELETRGFEPGDEVEIAGAAFRLYPGVEYPG